MEGLKGEAPIERDIEGVEGWTMGKVSLYPKLTTESGNIVSSPPIGVRGRAPTENEFGYSTAVSVTLKALIRP